MVKISFLSHDYIEFKHNNKEYTMDLRFDKHEHPIDWSHEINQIKKATFSQLKNSKYATEYGLEEIKKEKDTRPDFMKKFFGN